MSTASRDDVERAILAVRATVRLQVGKWYIALDAAREHAAATLRHLDETDDTFLVESLERSFAVMTSGGGYQEAVVSEVLVKAMEGRQCAGADELLRRMAMHEGDQPWLAVLVVQILGGWDARRFAPILRDVILTGRPGLVRAWAAEFLIRRGLASAAETDAWLCDREDSVRLLAARGLADLGTPDAVVRLWEQARSADDERYREQANVLLANMQLVWAIQRRG